MVAELLTEAYLLEGLDRIHAAIDGADAPETLFERMLEAALEIFGSDDARLLFPCDPAVGPAQIVLEKTNYRAGSARSVDAPTGPQLARLVWAAAASQTPLVFCDVDAAGARSTLAIAIRPRSGAMFLLALERLESTQAPLSSDARERLLSEFARRMSDALSVLLTIRKLEDTRRKMEAAEQMAHLGYWDRDFANNSIAGSREALRMFGLSREDSTSLERWQDMWRTLIHPHDRTRVGEAMAAAISGGPPYDIVYRIVRSDGQERVIHSRGEVTRDEAGRPRYMFGIMQDITEQKQIEEQLRQSQKMEAIGRLAGGVAHDFNNLLTIINGSADLALNLSAKDEGTEQLLGDIRHAGERAAGLTRQLLAFSRRQLLEPQIVNLNAILEELRRLLRRVIGEHIELELLTSKGLWLVKIDPGQFEQAIINLAVNARDAMTNGGRLTIETSNVSVDVAAANPDAGLPAGRYAKVLVRDTGEGMDAITRTQAFEPFFTTKPVGQGTGLGLAMVYGFVKQSGGHIELESTPGRGTRIDLYLPQTNDAPARPAADASPTRSRPRATETILLVEDEPAVRRLCKNILESEGYRVISAGDGGDALQQADNYRDPIDLVLTDLVMPRLAGTALVERLRRQRPALRALFMSGYADEPMLRASSAAPEVGFIGKPFSPAALLSKLRELLAPEAPRPGH